MLVRIIRKLVPNGGLDGNAKVKLFDPYMYKSLGLLAVNVYMDDADGVMSTGP
jgi:hypothetical protein